MKTNTKPAVCMFVAVAALLPLCCMARLKAASLNPVVSDLARQVGGERIELFELMKPGENPHVYEPTPEQLRQAHDADIVMAAGKALETYLPDLRDSLGKKRPVLEVGRDIPSLRIGKNEIFICCPAHANNGIDPHWWHSIRNLQRAARIIADAFGEIDPDGREYYRTRCHEYSRRLDTLEKWVKKQIYRIPRKNRILTTSHTSFGYFCRDYDFKSVPVQGLSTEGGTEPKHVAFVVEAIRRENIKVVFPEKNVNPKLLETVMKETGVKAGGYLLAGSPEPEDPTCEAMIRHNVETIVRALAPAE